MEIVHIVLLIGAGLAGGFLSGLVGVGGGIIYGPVLLYYFRAIGIEDPLLTPLTLGTSLLCVGATAFSGALVQMSAGAVAGRVAAITGGFAAVSVYLTGDLITTQEWYNQRLFQIVLGSVLLYVVTRLMLGRRRQDDGSLHVNLAEARLSIGRLAAIGIATGVLVAAAGVGGGVVLVPLFSGWLRLPLKVAMATSLASIVLVSAVGILTYVVLGIGQEVPAGAVGYVDFLNGLLLVAPALLTARLGVQAAHRAPVKVVRGVFAVLAAVVAVLMIGEAIAV